MATQQLAQRLTLAYNDEIALTRQALQALVDEQSKAPNMAQLAGALIGCIDRRTVGLDRLFVADIADVPDKWLQLFTAKYLLADHELDDADGVTLLFDALAREVDIARHQTKYAAYECNVARVTANSTANGWTP